MDDKSAGWYPDSNLPGTERWWDGSNWTGQTRPSVPQSPAPKESPGPTVQQPPSYASVPGSDSMSTELGASQVAGSGKSPSVVVWAFVLSILGFCGITAIVGLVLGIIGRGKAKTAGSGVGLATASIVISCLWLLFAGFVTVVGFNADPAQEGPAQASSISGPTDAASSTAAPSGSPTPSGITYQVLLAGKSLTNPKICKKYESDLDTFSEKTSKLITSARNAVKGPYVAQDYVAEAEWLWTDMLIKLSDAMNEDATAALDAQTGGSSSKLSSIEFYLADSIDECGLANKWATAKDQAVTANDLAGRIQTQADSAPWYPKGYVEREPGLAYKWVENPDSDCYYCSYWQMDVIARDGCPNGLYAEINIENSSGTVIDWTNDRIPSLSQGDKARLTFETYNDASDSASVTELSCS